MNNMKHLGNKQLSLHYEIIQHKLNDIQIAIIDDISEILGKTPNISHEIYTNPEKFKHYCERYRLSIEQEKKELFLILMKETKEIKEEIGKRQIKMLKEIGITTPSRRVQMIMKETQGTYFQ